MAIPRARTDLARLGAWSAAIGHAPRVLGGAAVTNRRAQLIKEIFWMGVTLTPAGFTSPKRPSGEGWGGGGKPKKQAQGSRLQGAQEQAQGSRLHEAIKRRKRITAE